MKRSSLCNQENFCYLKGTLDSNLVFHVRKSNIFIGYVDTDYVYDFGKRIFVL